MDMNLNILTWWGENSLKCLKEETVAEIRVTTFKTMKSVNRLFLLI